MSVDDAQERGSGRAASTSSDAFKAEMIEEIPFLRAIARGLCGNRAEADDLTQEALARAWKAKNSFEPGSNMRAWLVVIMRNQFYSERRRSWRTQRLSEEAEHSLRATDDQTSVLALGELRRAFELLPEEQREALLLVGVGGFSYEEAAELCGCAVGTIKSRASRARRSLEQILADPRTPLPIAREASDQAVSSLIEEANALIAKAPAKNAL